MVNRFTATPPGDLQISREKPRAGCGRRQRPGGRGSLVALLALALSVGGCAQPPWRRPLEALMQQGHAATVECLLGERAITGGDELRCEDWAYVRDNYLSRAE